MTGVGAPRADCQLNMIYSIVSSHRRRPRVPVDAECLRRGQPPAPSQTLSASVDTRFPRYFSPSYLCVPPCFFPSFLSFPPSLLSLSFPPSFLPLPFPFLSPFSPFF